jgi:Spy/CpxP family protein refolding chaperone
MKNVVKSIAIILALVASSALAQQMAPPSGDPAMHMQHHFAMLTKHLELTAAQQQQATTLFNNVMATQTTIHNNMKTAHDSLAAAIKSNDTGAIEQAANTIGNLTAQMTSNHAKAMAAFLQILTPEQQAKMTEFESQHGHFDGPEGFHGPHGHPGAHSGKPQPE